MAIDVDWTHGAAHMWDRHKVAVTEADEAIADIDAVWFDPDPHSKSGKAPASSATATAAGQS